MNAPDLFNLTGKVAIVTGAGSGLGRAFAEGLAEAGSAVVCADLDGDAAIATAQALNDRGLRAYAVRTDVTDEEAVDQLVNDTVERLGQLDAFFSNAGVAGGGRPAHETPRFVWDRVIAVNLTSVFLCARAAARVMMPRGSGKIVNTASIYGLVGSFSGTSPEYTAAKGGVVNLTRELAIEYAPHGIQVNAIAPGFFDTNIFRSGGLTEAQKDERLALVRERAPTKRVGRPEDLKGTAVYLASAASDHVTGHILSVDGGWLAW
ncbi:MAG TPA: glucose 1-dehydrogenase [Dehalococcoidia bacterium]|nr:glucose 1-dehydrogenase [Dehalococcoidia bacterium]